MTHHVCCSSFLLDPKCVVVVAVVAVAVVVVVFVVFVFVVVAVVFVVVVVVVVVVAVVAAIDVACVVVEYGALSPVFGRLSMVSSPRRLFLLLAVVCFLGVLSCGAQNRRVF